MKYTITAAILLLSTSVFAQLKKTVHQTFDIGEATTIQLDIYGDYELEAWPGNTIMSETQIELYDASPHVLKFFMDEQERYKIIVGEPGDQVMLSSKDKERKEIQYKGTTCYESVKVKLYIPEEFSLENKQSLRKKG